jgi:L-seryl-tRNA(Ser) seleniumtransferase
MISRRAVIKKLSTVPVIGSLIGTGALGSATQVMASNKKKRDYFGELGVRTFINAAGTYTALTASLMPPEVVDSINYATHHYVEIDELQQKVGARIASMLKCEDALVSSGAFGAIVLGTAAVMAGKDSKKIMQLPNDLRGMKNEVIIQKAHRVGYDRAVRNCGCTIVEVETVEDLEKAINEYTAMMFFLNFNNNEGKIKDREFVAIGKKHNIPTFNDCAADVPPVENLWKYTEMGFDLVAFSGGKGIKGPQSAGLLLGRKDLIEAARLNMPPRANIGRGMKVNKEEILAMMIALELYLAKDHQKEWQYWEDQISFIEKSIAGIPGISTERYVPEIANHVPSLRILFDKNTIKHTPQQIKEALKRGKPSIELAPNFTDDTLNLTVWMMLKGEEKYVGQRLSEELRAG